MVSYRRLWDRFIWLAEIRYICVITYIHILGRNSLTAMLLQNKSRRYFWVGPNGLEAVEEPSIKVDLQPGFTRTEQASPVDGAVGRRERTHLEERRERTHLEERRGRTHLAAGGGQTEFHSSV